MAQAKTRKKAHAEVVSVPATDDARTPMERTMDLARRLFAVSKAEVPTHKPKRRKRKRSG